MSGVRISHGRQSLGCAGCPAVRFPSSPRRREGAWVARARALRFLSLPSAWVAGKQGASNRIRHVGCRDLSPAAEPLTPRGCPAGHFPSSPRLSKGTCVAKVRTTGFLSPLSAWVAGAAGPRTSPRMFVDAASLLQRGLGHTEFPAGHFPSSPRRKTGTCVAKARTTGSQPPLPLGRGVGVRGIGMKG